MNNVISVNEKDIEISAFLKSINVSFKAVHVGMRKDKDWKGDQFQVVLSRSNNGARIATDFTNGTGHRIVRAKGVTAQDAKNLALLDNLKVSIVAQEDWTADDHKLARKLSPGVNFCKVYAVAPTAGSVLYCLQSDAMLGSDTHADFCANMDYDEDSRKGLEMYLACQKIGNEFNAFFTHDEREKLNGLLEDY